MPYYSDVAVRNALPGADDLPPEDLDQLAQDAGEVYGYVHHQPGCSDAQLRRWGERKGIDADRMNRALALLRATNKLYEIADLGPAADEEAQSERPKRSRRAKS